MLHFIYIFFSTNISSEYFKHAAHSPFSSSKCRLFHNATFFGSCIIHILYTGCAKNLNIKLRCQKVKERVLNNYNLLTCQCALPERVPVNVFTEYCSFAGISYVFHVSSSAFN